MVAVSKLREVAYCQVPAFQLDLEKFLDDVRNGIYPLTAFAPLAHTPIKLPSVCLFLFLNLISQTGEVPLPPTTQPSLPDEKPQPSLALTSNTQRPEPDPTPSPRSAPEGGIHRENRHIKDMKVSTQGK